ncbi:hypothetical protein QL285_039332 [Trifolium repens]|nr:hypothetical protein QL285_039332 [Trifolium repens]
MDFLHVQNFPRLQTLPEWIEEIAETLQTIIITNIPMLWKLPECLTRIMTSLKMLHIFDCPLLDDLPSGMHRLASLEALNGFPELCRKCQPHTGEYWPMISRIKRVNIGKPEEEPQEGEGSLFSNDYLLPYLRYKHYYLFNLAFGHVSFLS